MEEVKISTAGDSALLIEFGQEISPEINARITAFVHLLKAQRIEGVQDMIPAFTSLLINYDPRVVNYKTLTKRTTEVTKTRMSMKRHRHPEFLKSQYVMEENTDQILKISQKMLV